MVQSFDSGSPTPSQESPTPEDTLSLARWLGVHWDRGLGKKHLLPSPLPPNCAEVPTWGPYLPMSGEIPGFAHRPLSDLWPWPPALSPAWGLPSCRPHRRCRACPSRPVRCKGQRVRGRSDSTHLRSEHTSPPPNSPCSLWVPWSPVETGRKGEGSGLPCHGESSPEIGQRGGGGQPGGGGPPRSPGRAAPANPPPARWGPATLGTGNVVLVQVRGAAQPKLCLTHLLPSASFFSLHSKQRRRGGCYWGPTPDALGELRCPLAQPQKRPLGREGRHTFIPW